MRYQNGSHGNMNRRDSGEPEQSREPPWRSRSRTGHLRLSGIYPSSKTEKPELFLSKIRRILILGRETPVLVGMLGLSPLTAIILEAQSDYFSMGPS